MKKKMRIWNDVQHKQKPNKIVPLIQLLDYSLCALGSSGWKGSAFALRRRAPDKKKTPVGSGRFR